MDLVPREEERREDLQEMMCTLQHPALPSVWPSVPVLEEHWRALLQPSALGQVLRTAESFPLLGNGCLFNKEMMNKSTENLL